MRAKCRSARARVVLVLTARFSFSLCALRALLACLPAGLFGNQDSSLGNSSYALSVHSSDKDALVAVRSQGKNATARVAAGYLNHSMVLLHAAGSASQFRLLHLVERTVTLEAQKVGNDTVMKEVAESLYQKLEVRNDEHKLLTLGVDELKAAGGQDVSTGRLSLDGDVFFCDAQVVQPCNVTLSSSGAVMLTLSSTNKSAVLTVTPAKGKRASLDLMTHQDNAIQLYNARLGAKGTIGALQARRGAGPPLPSPRPIPTKPPSTALSLPSVQYPREHSKRPDATREYVCATQSALGARLFNKSIAARVLRLRLFALALAGAALQHRGPEERH